MTLLLSVHSCPWSCRPQEPTRAGLAWRPRARHWHAHSVRVLHPGERPPSEGRGGRGDTHTHTHTHTHNTRSHIHMETSKQTCHLCVAHRNQTGRDLPGVLAPDIGMHIRFEFSILVSGFLPRDERWADWESWHADNNRYRLCAYMMPCFARELVSNPRV